MFNLQGSEIIVILLLALVVLGPEKLPDAIRRFTQTYNELKKMGTGFQSELKSALDEPVREMRETAEAIRNAADPEKITAEFERSSTRPAPGDPPLGDPPVAADADSAADGDATTTQPGGPDLSDTGAVETAEEAAAEPVVSAEEPVETPDGTAGPDGAEPAPRVNQIAAANASGAIAARTAATAEPPPGPSFHSAAPRRSPSPGDEPATDVEPRPEIEPRPDVEPATGVEPPRGNGAHAPTADDPGDEREPTDETAPA